MLMDTSMIILRQTAIMFIYMAIGWGMFRGKLVSKEGSQAMAHLLLYVVLPCVIVRSFCIKYTSEHQSIVVIAMIGALVVLISSIAISFLMFRKRPIDQFGAAFSNAGFMGIPLISAALGESAIVHIAAMVALLNALQWTYGQMVLTGDKKAMSLKAAATSPVVLALAIGLGVFFLRIPVPDIVLTCMGNLAQLNAPVAMIILGVYLGEVKLSEIFLDIRAWQCSFVRLLVIPLITIVCLKLLFPGHPELSQALLIAAIAPVGSNVAVYARKLNKDYQYAVKLVCLSTLLSVVTMPVTMLLYSIL